MNSCRIEFSRVFRCVLSEQRAQRHQNLPAEAQHVLKSHTEEFFPSESNFFLRFSLIFSAYLSLRSSSNIHTFRTLKTITVICAARDFLVLKPNHKRRGATGGRAAGARRTEESPQAEPAHAVEAQLGLQSKPGASQRRFR